MIPAALTDASAFVGAAGTFAVATVRRWRGTALAATCWCAAAYLATAITLVAGACRA